MEEALSHMALLPSGTWENLRQGLTHTWAGGSAWTLDALFPVGKFNWTQGVTPFSDWQVRVCCMSAWMHHRPAYNFVLLSGLHNMGLSMFSGVMCMLAYEEVYLRLQNHGVIGAFCTSHPETAATGRYSFVLYIYYLSHYAQLFDTVLLILAKRPLRVLHLFHHMTMLPLAWAWLQDRSVFAMWIVLVDSIAQIFVYYFYTQFAMKQHVSFKQRITLGQIAQYGSTLFFGMFYLAAQQMSQPTSWMARHLSNHARPAATSDEAPGVCRGGDGAFWLTIAIHTALLIMYTWLYQRNALAAPTTPAAAAMEAESSKSDPATAKSTSVSTGQNASSEKPVKRKGKRKTKTAATQ
ncbi:GNS1/SUR4 family-domain-containing protein [Thamnocephalis sphaerospora]|uniref:Elongation of fatty acids protein n=1 Tax=Thamnocephalis sphaerospora TaxID=78915 RepID=A0A4P9XKK7_9FUNG|nr:GNS1/SUR4 family-domain-containing protein [Thamnocephalis sphaerospora]|eukprot:RKP06337.1 GNS1/SUR4 family-domain-containing protein [Thamnocephalis sphaerospora]